MVPLWLSYFVSFTKYAAMQAYQKNPSCLLDVIPLIITIIMLMIYSCHEAQRCSADSCYSAIRLCVLSTCCNEIAAGWMQSQLC